jgi:TonB family protein
MPSKILLLVVLGLANLAATARAEPTSLFEIAPFCRSVLKARFVEQRGDTLIFDAERIYAGDEPVKLQVPVSRWRRAWGQAREGFEGFFAYRRNAEVDAVFPIVDDGVLVDLTGEASVEESQSGSWMPLVEVEAKLAEAARRHDALALTVSASDRDPHGYQVVFTNHGPEPIAVNRGGRLEYLVFDIRRKLLFRKVEPGRQAPDSVNLRPGESTSVEAPAQIVTHVTEEPVQFKVIYSNSKAENEPSHWYGKKQALLWTFREPVGLRSGPVLYGPAPRYTELAARARVTGEVRVSVTVLPSGEVANAFVLAGQPMGLDAASLEAVNQWRFAPSETKRDQEIVFEFNVADDWDPEPPFERLGDYRIRVWRQRESFSGTFCIMTVDQDGKVQCSTR